MSKEDEDREDRAVLAWLQGGQKVNDGHAQDPMLTAFLRERSESPTVDLDSELRDFGLSRDERDEALRPKRRLRPGDSRYKGTVVKQFRWWIDQRVDWSKTELNPDYVTAMWTNLAKCDLDLAKSWWNAGIDPLNLEQITNLARHNFHPRDIVIRINGRTILEHLGRGASIEWCVHAKNWFYR